MARGSWGIGSPLDFANRLDESGAREIGESFVSSPVTHRLGMILHRSGRIVPVASGQCGTISPIGSPPAPR